jgi:hypothetical protein
MASAVLPVEARPARVPSLATAVVNMAIAGRIRSTAPPVVKQALEDVMASNNLVLLLQVRHRLRHPNRHHLQFNHHHLQFNRHHPQFNRRQLLHLLLLAQSLPMDNVVPVEEAKPARVPSLETAVRSMVIAGLTRSTALPVVKRVSEDVMGNHSPASPLLFRQVRFRHQALHHPQSSRRPRSLRRPRFSHLLQSSRRPQFSHLPQFSPRPPSRHRP